MCQFKIEILRNRLAFEMAQLQETPRVYFRNGEADVKLAVRPAIVGYILSHNFVTSMSACFFDNFSSALFSGFSIPKHPVNLILTPFQLTLQYGDGSFLFKAK